MLHDLQGREFNMKRFLLDTTNPTKLMKAYGSVRQCCVNIGSNFQPHVSRCFLFLHL
ncbi:unnamed protein product [Musa acuminata subsp. malaccensis]|uniref:(wild Malaysian banana) hypothetical protein n=1 Tax=Musa acuminata subsp. malaccensis TaxID=214687 RepID=A0A804HS63_MUSAM|nr:unnamed protein product [Musa acuminata subsp. malaccensis]